MKIKRIFAQDMRQAIRKVREELGPDAVILSSRNVDGGVEVISAMDYDERVIRAAAEAAPQPSFADTLNQVARAPTPTAGKPAPARQKIDISIDDDIDLSTTFAEPAPAPRAEPAKPLPKVEWTQEPAISEMRRELKTLRSLFENQLTLMEWQQMGQRQPVRATILRQLTELGLGPDVCRKVADHVATAEADPDRAWQRALAVIARHLPVTNDDILDRGGIVAMVGPTGVGKTTTVAKLAARFALRHGRGSVALVSTDNFRIGAQDQLRSFARILGAPVHAAGSRQELEAVLAEVKDKRLVLIDTAGMSQRDMRLSDQFQALAAQRVPIRIHVVLSANTQLAALNETVRAFRRVKPVACIITKLDESASLGGALTVALRHQLPIAYLGTGQRVPEDLQPARSDKLIEHARALAEHHRQETDDETLALTFGGAVNADH
jgi:flagellar biosynthesis protein FlhF